jgi:glycosyltransferase involved in cell wall biosynthesis
MPGQFRFLAATLAQSPQFAVSFLTRREGIDIKGIRTIRYPSPKDAQETPNPLLAPVERVLRFGQAVLNAALALRKDGYNPRLIVAHPGWGEALFLRDVWPKARIITYGEYYYRADGGDIGFDPIFPVTPNGLARSRMMNTHLLLAHEQADAVLSPTQWQKNRHPAFIQNRTEVIFDGIDTTRVCPDPAARFPLPDGRSLSRKDEVITYVARNLEPHRGFHVLMQALPALLAKRPLAHVVIVGGDELSYSPAAPGHPNWKAKMLAEVDLGDAAKRVHFMGKIAYADYLALLRVSAVHLYLTYPFVLSWSCMEAMAAGCLMVASDTGPVQEVISHGENGLLFPFFDGQAMVETICAALDNGGIGQSLRQAARETVVARYDLRQCLAAQVQMMARVLQS